MKGLKVISLSIGALLVSAVPALAQAAGAGAAAASQALIEFSAPFGVGMTIIGAAYGISKLASAALEGMARQPEVAANIQTAMIIAAALIEGVTLFALFICMNA